MKRLLTAGVAASIAVVGAFIGGLISYFYVRYKIHKNKHDLSLQALLFSFIFSLIEPS